MEEKKKYMDDNIQTRNVGLFSGKYFNGNMSTFIQIYNIQKHEFCDGRDSLRDYKIFFEYRKRERERERKKRETKRKRNVDLVCS
jgi:hypothetical protein